MSIELKPLIYINVASMEELSNHGFTVVGESKAALEKNFQDPFLQHQTFIFPAAKSIHSGPVLRIIGQLEDNRADHDILSVRTQYDWSIQHDKKGFYYLTPYKHGHLCMKQSWDKEGWKVHYVAEYNGEDLMAPPEKDINKLALEVEKLYRP
ncbi:hypothetical protein CN918_29830 [Priestia megaterium]|nr:hypothetical protein CN918_29830 [Priestia megaterium]